MKDAKKIARIIRLLDWLNTGIDQRREKYTVRNFYQSYTAKFFFRYSKEIYEEFYAVFVLYRIFLGNKSSVAKMSKRLIPVVATSLIKKINRFPNDSHSRKSIYP